MNENEFNDNVNESSGSEQDNQFTDDSIRIHSDMVVTEDEDRMPEAPVFMALYTTLMLLLMTFFIVLVSMGSSSMGKFEKTKQSVRSNFNVLGLGGSKQSLYFLYSILKIKSHVIRDALNLHLPSDQQEISDVADEGGRIYWEDGVSKEEASQLHRFIALGFNIH